MIKNFQQFNESSDPMAGLIIPHSEIVARLEDLNKRYREGSLKVSHKQYLRRHSALRNINSVSNQIKRFGARVTRKQGYRGIYIYHGKNFTLEVWEDCCETCWWQVSYEDDIDPRVDEFFYDYNQFDTKADVLQSVLQLDFNISNNII